MVICPNPECHREFDPYEEGLKKCSKCNALHTELQLKECEGCCTLFCPTVELTICVRCKIMLCEDCKPKRSRNCLDCNE